MEENFLSDKHIPVLDGLRGFAVLYVIIFHFFPSATSSGFLTAIASFGFSGVDLFFVLSGFLITGILIRSKTEKNYFFNFYVRRFLRIFPLYYSMLFIFLIVVPHITYFRQFNYFTIVDGASYPYWLFLMNYPSFHSLTHQFLFVAWSLCIEEQYYLFVPAIVYLLNKERLLNFLLLVFTASFLIRTISFFVFHTDASVLYHSAYTRLEGIALGGILRLSFENNGLKNHRQRFASLFPLFALLVSGMVVFCKYIIVEPVSLNYHPLMITFGYLLSSLMYGSLMTRCLIENKNGYTRTFFSTAFLRTTGKYSYAMYLFHPLAIGIAKAFLAKGYLMFQLDCLKNDSLPVIAGMLLTYAMSIASWNILEKPALQLKRRFA